MSRVSIDAGKLDQHLEVLELKKTAEGTWEWVQVRRSWASVTPQFKSNLFSRVGIGAKDMAVVMRRRELTLHHALRWKGQHLLLTSIIPRGRLHLEINAAMVDVVECLANPAKTPAGPRFPGVLTEKYVGHEQLDPNAVVSTTFVLVTPKAISLRPGNIVMVAGGYYRVQVAHELDAWKNEYEIARRDDC